MPSWTLPLLKGNPIWGQRLSSANTFPSCEQSSSGRSSPRTVIICFSCNSASDAARKNSARLWGAFPVLITKRTRTLETRAVKVLFVKWCRIWEKIRRNQFEKLRKGIGSVPRTSTSWVVRVTSSGNGTRAKTSASSVEPLLLSRRSMQTRLAGRLALPFYAPRRAPRTRLAKT